LKTTAIILLAIILTLFGMGFLPNVAAVTSAAEDTRLYTPAKDNLIVTNCFVANP